MNITDIKLCDDIFSRKYSSDYYVWSTKTQAVISVNEMAFDIISNLKKYYIPLSELIDTLSDIYDVTDDEINQIVAFIQELKSLHIVDIKPDFHKGEKDIESQIIEITSNKNILYQVMFELTYTCNERCQHCYIDWTDNRKQLSLLEVKNVIDQLDEMNVASIAFSGGEIFTRSDSVEIIEYASKKNLLVTIFSNGTLLSDDDLLRIASARPMGFHSSLIKLFILYKY